jgi:hypothetical protein
MTSHLQNCISQNIWELHGTLMETGSCPRVKAEHEQWWRGEDDVLAAVKWSPSISTCRMSSATGVAQTQVWRIFHHDGFYPHHLQRVQHLLLADEANCVQFHEWLQPQLHILHNILFTDDAQFTWDSTTNTRNSLSWAYKNPYVVAEHHWSSDWD